MENINGKPWFKRLCYLKYDLKMKLTFTILLVSFLHLQATTTTYAQNTKLTLQMEGAKIAQIIEAIESKSEFRFLFDRDIIDLERTVNIDVRAKKIGHILRVMFKGSDLEYNVENRQIVLNKSKLIKTIKNTNIDDEAAQQEFQVTGTVTDQNGGPLPGANVVVAGTTTGVQTDFDGNFEITVPNGGVLEISYVGFALQRFTITEDQNLQVRLQEDSAALDEVVVVGYGTQNKRAVTSAISSISGEELGETSNDSFNRALTGKIAGVQIQQTTGAPGGNIVVRVRGTGSLSAGNDPLYVIDGFPVEQSNIGPDNSSSFNNTRDQGINPLASLNPDDIESIQVLKDASAAAIYGSRGANGVVIITTKRGRSGEAQFNFTASLGTQSAINRIDVLNGDQFLDFLIEAYENADATTSPGILFPQFLDNEAQFRGINTDWQDQIFRAAAVQNYQLSASGGSEKFQYFISGSYMNEEGVILSSGFERFSLRTNFDAQLTDRLKLGVSFTPSFTINDEVNAEGHWANNAVVNQALVTFPFLRPDQNSEDFINSDPNNTCCGVPNPRTTAELFDAESTQLRLLSNTYLEYDILTGLKAKTSFGFDFLDFERNEFNPAEIQRNDNNNRANTSKFSQRSWLTENTLNYTKAFGKHNFNVLGGFTFQKFRQQENFIGAVGLANTIVRTITDFNAVTEARSVVEEWSLVSLLGRVNYNFDNKYFLSAAVRRDGSSRFGTNNQFATFPSISAGWAISEEGFLKDNEKLSFLKLRASYGTTGNNTIGNYSSIALLDDSNYVLGPGNGEGVTGLQPNTIGNEDLTWETTTQYDIGLEVGLFSNRLSLVADYYSSDTEDLLLNVPIPNSTGFSSALQNLGRVRNTGWEFQLSSRNFSGDFTWDTDFNITFAENEILELGPEGDPILAGSGAGNIFLNEIGGELGAFFVYEQIGIFQTQEEIDNSATWDTSRGTFPGDVKYRDQNGDGVIDGDDRVVIGSNNPDFIWGITNTFSYKNFDLSIVVNGVEGNLIHNISRRFYNNLEGNQNQYSNVLNRWRSPEQPGDGMTPRANRLTSGNNNISETSRWVEDGSFVRIQNVALGYNFPRDVAERLKLNSLRLFASVNNLAYFTDYAGYNPEASLSGGGALNRGADYGSYPLARRLTMGLKVGF